MDERIGLPTRKKFPVTPAMRRARVAQQTAIAAARTPQENKERMAHAMKTRWRPSQEAIKTISGRLADDGGLPDWICRQPEMEQAAEKARQWIARGVLANLEAKVLAAVRAKWGGA